MSYALQIYKIHTKINGFCIYFICKIHPKCVKNTICVLWGSSQKHTQKILPGILDIVKNAPKILPGVFLKYVYSIFDGNEHPKGAVAFGRRPLWVNSWFKILLKCTKHIVGNMFVVWLGLPQDVSFYREDHGHVRCVLRITTTSC